MKYILALDQGTTSSRAILFDADGRSVAVAQREFEQIFPRPGWVEHDPNAIWSSQLAVAREALERAEATHADVAAIGIANQRETTLLWDRATGEPLANAIVWQDRRTAERCEQLVRDGHDVLIRERTGLVVDAYFAATKLAWLLDNVPNARTRAEAGELAFGTVETWLVWKLTGGRVHVTDASNASRTMLLDTRSGAWDDDLLRLFDIPAALLPEVRSNSEVVAESDADLFGGPIPIAGLAGDQHGALFGQACFERGMAKNTYGTGSFMLMHAGDTPVPSQHRLLSTVAWKIGEKLEYALEGSIFVTGAAVQWLRDGLGLIENSADVEPLANSVEDADGVVFVPAFTGLGAPHWDGRARGTLVGLTRGTTAAHIARATLDAIAHQTADVLDAMQADAHTPLVELRVDGGASANDLLMQIQADLLGIPVVRPTQLETTALGAAYLAGLAVGFWPNRAALAEHWQEDRRFEPRSDPAVVESSRERWRDAVGRSRGWGRDE